MPQKYPQRNQLKHTKKRYRVRNWREYEAGLCKRGDLTLWFSEDALRDWHPSVGTKPDGQRHYSDAAIETALTVRAAYGLALRQTEGFLRSIARLLQLDIEIPDHTTLSRRSSTLKAHVRIPGTTDSPVHILIDSTGLKAHRGPTAPADKRNRRTWRKLHLIVDATTAEILTQSSRRTARVIRHQSEICWHRQIVDSPRCGWTALTTELPSIVPLRTTRLTTLLRPESSSHPDAMREPATMQA